MPVDFSTATPHVLNVAGQLAKSLAADVQLIHVKEIPPTIPPVTAGYGMAAMPELMPVSTLPLVQPLAETAPPHESENQKLAEWKTELQQQGIQVTINDSMGDVVDEILRRAESAQVDLIVMGRHGHGAMYKLLVGSVTEGVLKRSRWPVLLVPELR